MSAVWSTPEGSVGRTDTLCITSHHITLHHTTPYHITPHHTTSHHTSHHITSHHLTLFSHSAHNMQGVVMQLIPFKHTHVHTPSHPPAHMSTMDHICTPPLTFSRRAFSSCSVESWEASSSRSLKDCCSRARHLTGGRDGGHTSDRRRGMGAHIRQEEGMGGTHKTGGRGWGHTSVHAGIKTARCTHLSCISCAALTASSWFLSLRGCNGACQLSGGDRHVMVM